MANAKLLPNIRNAMGYSTITMALREFSLTLEPAGLMLNFTTGMVGKQKPAPDLMLSTLTTHCEEGASLFLDRLVAYLDINAATYPLYPTPNQTKAMTTTPTPESSCYEPQIQISALHYSPPPEGCPQGG